MTGLEESGVLQAAREEYQQYMTLQHSCSKDEETLCDRCMQPINAGIIEKNLVILKVKSHWFGMMWVCLPSSVSTRCAPLLGLTTAQWAAFHCTKWLHTQESLLSGKSLLESFSSTAGAQQHLLFLWRQNRGKCARCCITTSSSPSYPSGFNQCWAVCRLRA